MLTPRKILPIETFRITTGIRGGIAGGTAMVVPATLFSLLKYHSLWYSVNLLAAGGFVSWAGASDTFLSQFHLQGVLAGFLIQGFVSLLVGLLYGAMLPMFPRYPILTAGFMAPLLITGIVHSALGVVSPILNQRIDWFWFIMSQIAFGLVCGYVVNLQARVRTPQFRALAIRGPSRTPHKPGRAQRITQSPRPRGRQAAMNSCAHSPSGLLACAVAFAVAGCNDRARKARPQS